MAKRFRDNTISRQTWYRKLNPIYKCVWNFICDDCDQSGVWEIDLDALDFYLSEIVDIPEFIKAINSDKERIVTLGDRKLFIPGFIEFQYGRLSLDCKPHIPVFKLLDKHGLDVAEIKMAPDIGKTHNVSEKTRQGIFKQDNYTCCYCNKTKDKNLLVIDHVVSRKKGGDDGVKNLMTSCISCNAKKSDFSLEDFCLRNDLDFLFINNRVTQRLSQRVPCTLEEKEEEQEKEKEKDERGLGGKQKPDRRPTIRPDKKHENGEAKQQYREIVKIITSGIDVKEKKIKLADFIAASKPDFIEPYMDIWNLSALKYGLSQVEGISDGRVNKFKTRFKEPMFDFIKILTEINQSNYLQGKEKDWKIDWDWIFENDTNYLKVMEGKYRNSRN